MSQSPHGTVTSEGEPPRARKRARRCGNASRKQRCDGDNPCGNCVHYKVGVECVFESPVVKRADEVSLNYIAALEERCALLESALLRADPTNVNVQDHLSSTRRADRDRDRRHRPSRPGVNGQEVHFASTHDTSEALTANQQDMPITPPPTTLVSTETSHSQFISPQQTLQRSTTVYDDHSHGCTAAIDQPCEIPGPSSPPHMSLDDNENDNFESAINQHVNRLSMKAFAETPYIGELSGLSFAKLAGVDHLSPTISPEHMPLAPDRDSAETLYRAAYSHVQSRYPFMQISGTGRNGEKDCAFFLWLVYAVGACHLSPGVFADSSAKHYFAAAMQYLDDVLVKQDIFSIQALAMMAMYSFRAESISDDEIDVEEPLDVDCHQTDPDILSTARKRRFGQPGNITSMSSACHWIRLYRIRSGIMSRLKARNPMADEEINEFLQKLQIWKDSTPLQNSPPKDPRGDVTSSSADDFLHQQKSPLLAPGSGSRSTMLRESQTVSSDNPAHSMAALYSNFVSGLTLLHALASQRDILSPRRAARAIRACSSVLVAYATLFPEAQSFRIAFDDLVDGMEGDTSDAEPEQPVGDNFNNNGNEQSARDISSIAVALSAVRDTDTAGLEQRESSVSGTSDVWQKKVQDLGSMLQGNFQQDLFSLVTNLGYTPSITSSEPAPTEARLSVPMIVNNPFDTYGAANPVDGNMELANMFDFAAYSSAIEQ
ncbi:hypothetical protein I317_06813 [Kwoniella heveanensis CBS 569]|nr:hypothetical protein I317_06813 [Kwoniella heveanensis CBS 569]